MLQLSLLKTRRNASMVMLRHVRTGTVASSLDQKLFDARYPELFSAAAFRSENTQS